MNLNPLSLSQFTFRMKSLQILKNEIIEMGRKIFDLNVIKSNLFKCGSVYLFFFSLKLRKNNE